MKRTVCLVIIFLLAQVLSSLVVLFFFNLSDLLHEGRLDVNALASSPSVIKRGCGMGGDDFVEMDRP